MSPSMMGFCALPVGHQVALMSRTTGLPEDVRVSKSFWLNRFTDLRHALALFGAGRADLAHDVRDPANTALQHIERITF